MSYFVVHREHLHVLRRNRRHRELLPNAQYRQVRFVHRKHVLEQRRMSCMACRVLQFSVRVDVSIQRAKPCLRNKGLHVLRRNWRDRELLPNARYRQVRVMHRKQVLERRRMPRLARVLQFSVRVDVSIQHAQPCLFDKSLHVLQRNWRYRYRVPNAQYRPVRVVRR